MSETIAVHMHYKSLYISLASSVQQRRAMTKHFRFSPQEETPRNTEPLKRQFGEMKKIFSRKFPVGVIPGKQNRDI